MDFILERVQAKSLSGMVEKTSTPSWEVITFKCRGFLTAHYIITSPELFNN